MATPLALLTPAPLDAPPPRSSCSPSATTSTTSPAPAPARSSRPASRSGWRSHEIRDFYLKSGEAMFDKASLLTRFRYKYEDEQLAGKLKSELGADTTLGDRQAADAAADRHAQRHHRLAVAGLEQPRAKYNHRDAAPTATSICRCGSWCARAPLRRPTSRRRRRRSATQRVRLRRRRRDDVQQPGVPVVPDGDRRAVQAGLAGRRRTRCCWSRSAPARARTPTRTSSPAR